MCLRKLWCASALGKIVSASAETTPTFSGPPHQARPAQVPDPSRFLLIETEFLQPKDLE
jgi:hypothetical protein